MSAKRLFIAILGAALLSSPALAQHHQGNSNGMPQGPGSSHWHGSGAPHGSPSIGHTNPSWHDFGHNAPDVRVHPHRNGGSVFPVPHSWHGDLHNFDLGHWRGGQWRHEHHGGRLGWWWVVGPDWYFFDEPVYPFPDSYVPPGEIYGWWYWCAESQEYYPYVTYCPGGWERVLPRD
jgi:hypothetical protein